MDERFSRSERLMGRVAAEALSRARIIVFGVGGVGSWCAEALVRSGLKLLTIVDDDVVAVSNINRQGEAFGDNTGKAKVEEMALKLRRINPYCDITAIGRRFMPENAAEWQLGGYDYVVDAIDSVSSKAALIIEATSHGAGTKIYSSMGAALKLDPTRVKTAEFGKVSGDRLAKALRQNFKRNGRWPARKFYCVYSDEPLPPCATPPAKGEPNGSMMPVTATFGVTLASLIIKDIISKS